MPYYIYRIFEHPIRRLEKLEQHEAYREASARAKQLRKESPDEAAYRIKMIFGETELHAEDALNQVRERSLEPDD
ncbi:MAG: hypothetical protein ACM3W8_00220 [Sideroxydans sp.]|nr:hypothetical protein [Sideroxyarcus sp.]